MTQSETLHALAELNKEVRAWAPADPSIQEKQAVRALLKALNATSLYFSSQSQGAGVDSQTEAELSGLWLEASAAFYGIDAHIAPTLYLKSEAWARKEKWSDEKVRAAKIDIESVSELARDLLAAGGPQIRRSDIVERRWYQKTAFQAAIAGAFIAGIFGIVAALIGLKDQPPAVAKSGSPKPITESQKVVYIMDSPQMRYSKSWPAGVRNTQKILESLLKMRDLDLDLREITLTSEWDQKDLVANANPDLVIIHGSAFVNPDRVEQTKTEAPGEKIDYSMNPEYLRAWGEIDALITYVGTRSKATKFILYSKLGDNDRNRATSIWGGFVGRNKDFEELRSNSV